MAITLVMSGGLGNQLFQYAAARALSLARGVPLTIDLRFYTSAAPGSSRGAWLTDFPIAARVRTYRNAHAAHGALPRLVRRIVESRRYRSRELGFDPAVRDLPNGSVLFGLFQSPHYFADIYDSISPEIDMSTDSRLNGDPRIADYDLADAVGIHVRRGDYLDIPGFALNNADSYYAAAMREVRSHGERAVVFSDDLEWCRRQHVFAGADFFVGAPHLPPYFDLFALSRCRRLVIANSTFSWWAGWFAHQRGADVLAPRDWIFGHASRDIDILPTGFRTIDTATA